jgi:hypothetical protein
MKKIILSALIISSVLVGCYYDKADVINPNATFVGCDTTKVSYNAAIAPIITDNGCNVCHSGGSASSSGGGIVLDNYAGVHAAAISGQLVPAVRQDASCATCVPAYPAYEIMPKGGSKISSCNINKIIAWVNQGSQNN